MAERPSRSRELEDYVIVPPDGGWGWVIVIAAFYCQVIIDGIQLTFGMIIKEIHEEYKVSYSTASFIGSLIYGTHYLAGPICAGFSYHFGERPVSIVGSILSFIGLSLPFFFHLPTYGLHLSIGLLNGVGLCFVNMNSLIITTLYFSRKRIIALGMVVCGTGVGTIVFAVLADEVLKDMNWRTVCLVEGLLALSMAFPAVLFRPLKPILVKEKSAVKFAEVNEEETDEIEDIEDESKPHRIFYVRELASPVLTRQGSIGSFKEQTELVFEEVATAMIQPSISRQAKYFNGVMRICPCLSDHHHIRRILAINPKVKTTFFQKSSQSGVRRLSEQDDNPSHNLSETCFRIFGRMFDCQVLKSISFIAFCIASALSAAALLIIVIYEKVMLLSEGYEEDDAMWYLVGIGASNTIWRLVLGAISTIPRVRYQSLNVIGLIVGGLATAISPLMDSTALLYICGSLYGLATACFALYYPVILHELVGSEMVSNATGVSMMFMGVFSAIGAPLCGSIMESWNKPEIIFHIGGVMFIISGLIFLFITGRRRLV